MHAHGHRFGHVGNRRQPFATADAYALDHDQLPAGCDAKRQRNESAHDGPPFRGDAVLFAKHAVFA
jgi:hypothetical protein